MIMKLMAENSQLSAWNHEKVDEISECFSIWNQNFQESVLEIIKVTGENSQIKF